jgi:hypothetical protein
VGISGRGDTGAWGGPGVEVLALGGDAGEGEAALAAVLVAEDHVRVQPVPDLPPPASHHRPASGTPPTAAATVNRYRASSPSRRIASTARTAASDGGSPSAAGIRSSRRRNTSTRDTNPDIQAQGPPARHARLDCANKRAYRRGWPVRTLSRPGGTHTRRRGAARDGGWGCE